MFSVSMISLISITSSNKTYHLYFLSTDLKNIALDLAGNQQQTHPQ